MAGINAGDHIRAPSLNVTLDRHLATDTTSTIGTGGSEQVVSWSSPQTVSPNVTPSGYPGFTSFQLNKTGIWLIEFLVRVKFSVAPTAGDIFAWAYLKAGGVKLCGETEPAPITVDHAPLLQARVTRPFTVGDQVELRLSNHCDQACLVASVPDLSHISLCWLQPA